MVLSIHQTTSQRAGYRKILEGWAKAGIKYVEITDRALDDFLKTDIAAAKSVITDNGLTMVSGASVLQDFWNKNAGFPAQMETWKKRCEQFASLGSTKIYCPSTTNRMVKEEDYKTVPDAIREAGDVAKQYNLTGMIEFARSSTLISTLTTSLKLIREAGHPNVRPMLDCYHFWSNTSPRIDYWSPFHAEASRAVGDTDTRPRWMLCSAGARRERYDGALSCRKPEAAIPTATQTKAKVMRERCLERRKSMTALK